MISSFLPEILTIIAAITLIYVGMLFSMRRRNDQERYEFITMIAHKFRTPLTQIKWSAETLLDGSLDPYQRQGISDIRASNENLIKLTGTLIELTDPEKSAKSTYAFEQLNVCDLAHTAAAEAKTAFHEKNIFISIECADQEVTVRADRVRLRFALDTILENACTYSPPGRNVDVHVERIGQTAVISVVDHGIGIDPHDVGRVFGKFFRAKNALHMNTEGVGVGLYLARSIIKRHNGTIKVYSEGANKGSTFSISLPAIK